MESQRSQGAPMTAALLLLIAAGLVAIPMLSRIDKRRRGHEVAGITGIRYMW